MTHARGTPVFYARMDTVLGLILFVVYIAAILAAAAAITLLVIKLSPSEAAKEQRARAKAERRS
jgi:flagellar basal body-associated protein FliL